MLLVAAALAQVTWAPRFEVGGAFPNLVLLAVVGATWTLGPRQAMVWACAGGVLLDLTASGSIGPHALALLAGVYIVGFWTRSMERPTALYAALTAAVSTLLYSAVLLLTEGLLGLPVPPFSTVAWLAFSASLYNALLMPPVLEVLRRLRAGTSSGPEPA
jgi:rod shape-determining protein MreD